MFSASHSPFVNLFHDSESQKSHTHFTDRETGTQGVQRLKAVTNRCDIREIHSLAFGGLMGGPLQMETTEKISMHCELVLLPVPGGLHLSPFLCLCSAHTGPGRRSLVFLGHWQEMDSVFRARCSQASYWAGGCLGLGILPRSFLAPPYVILLWISACSSAPGFPDDPAHLEVLVSPQSCPEQAPSAGPGGWLPSANTL